MKVCIFIFFIFFGVYGLDPVGKVTQIEGEVRAGTQEDYRQLSEASPVYVGDLITTLEGASAEIVFTDGTVLSLISSSSYQIREYSAGFFQKKRYVGKIFEGGFRMLTGKIAKSNPDEFQVESPNATIGIRGTVFSMILEAGLAFFSCERGNIAIINDAGTLLIGQGQPVRFASVSSRNIIANPLQQKPLALEQRSFTQAAPKSAAPDRSPQPPPPQPQRPLGPKAGGAQIQQGC